MASIPPITLGFRHKSGDGNKAGPLWVKYIPALLHLLPQFKFFKHIPSPPYA